MKRFLLIVLAILLTLPFISVPISHAAQYTYTVTPSTWTNFSDGHGGNFSYKGDKTNDRVVVRVAGQNGGNFEEKRRIEVVFNSTVFGKLRFKTEQKQQIWQECSRLITNCIIFYNATILSTLLNHRESIGDIEGVAALKKVSPVAWQHINLYGRYEFTKAQDVIDMQEIIQEMVRGAISEKFQAVRVEFLKDV